MTKTEITVLVISSGLAAGLFSGLVSFATGVWERRHRTRERTAVQQHEVRLRREAAHDAARPLYLEFAEKFVSWARLHVDTARIEQGQEFMSIGTTLPTPTELEQVLDCLRRIRTGHPSKPVRVHAGSLCDDVEHQWTAFGAAGMRSSLNQATDWFERGESLIELIHAPEGATA